METLGEVCPNCGAELKLVGSEESNDKPGIVIHTYECECGEVFAAEDALN